METLAVTSSSPSLEWDAFSRGRPIFLIIMQPHSPENWTLPPPPRYISSVHSGEGQMTHFRQIPSLRGPPCVICRTRHCPALLCRPEEGVLYGVSQRSAAGPLRGFGPTPPEFPLREVPSPRVCISDSSPGDVMLWVLALGPHFENHCSINKPQDSGRCLSAFVWGRNDFLKIGVRECGLGVC